MDGARGGEETWRGEDVRVQRGGNDGNAMGKWVGLMIEWV